MEEEVKEMSREKEEMEEELLELIRKSVDNAQLKSCA